MESSTTGPSSSERSLGRRSLTFIHTSVLQLPFKYLLADTDPITDSRGGKAETCHGCLYGETTPPEVAHAGKSRKNGLDVVEHFSVVSRPQYGHLGP
jgi:hypothetical protein